MNLGNKIFIIILFCLIDFGIYASSINFSWYNAEDSIVANELYEKSKEFYENKILDSAQFYSEKSLQIAENLFLSELEIANLMLLADIHKDKNDLQFTNKYLLIAENKLHKKQDFSTLFKVYNDIGNVYVFMEAFDKSIEKFNSAIELIEYCKEGNQILQLFESLSFAHYKMENDSVAILYLNKSFEILNKGNNLQGKITILHRIVDILIENEEFEEAILKYTDIFDLYAELNNFTGMANSLNNIGYSYTLFNNYKKAIQAYKGALNIDHQSKLSVLKRAVVYVNIGICYQNSGNFDEALDNLVEALRIYESYQKFIKIAEVQHLIALIYLADNDLYNASYYAENSIHNARKAEDMELLKLCYETYSKILQQENEFEKALEYYQMYLSIRDSIILEQRIKEQEIFQQQYVIEKSEKEISLLLADQEVKDLALKQLRLEAETNEQEMQLLKQEKDLQDASLKQQELEKQKALQQLKLENQLNETKLQEQEIINLQNEKDLQEAELKQKELEEKEREKTITLLERESEINKLAVERQKEQRQKQRWIGMLFTIILIIATVGLVVTNKKNRRLAQQKQVIEETNVDLHQKNEEVITQKEHLEKANTEIKQANQVLEQKSEEILAQNEELNQKNEEISSQKEVIEQKNLDITDSIHYASKIQNAVLPPKELVDDIFDEYFVLWKPRDIVSGDFFWMRELDNKVVVVAADCTGHGVPGAFMSMLGVSLLNELVQPENFENAADILNLLRKEVKTSLRQTGKKGEAKDGMDCALCILEKDKGIMHYAGANNPLYIARNGEVEYFKADRMPIGIYVRSEDPFTNNIIKINEGDSIYIASDGYTDQFGGEFGKKFLTKNFKILLSEVYKKPMKYQHEILDKKLKDWMGYSQEQIDDILVVGFKV
jgi:serine phosphatase RsbU (regulator of sigma subunit)/tetratricopeptide (TPR) repeat protein